LLPWAGHGSFLELLYAVLMYSVSPLGSSVGVGVRKSLERLSQTSKKLRGKEVDAKVESVGTVYVIRATTIGVGEDVRLTY